MNSSDGTRRDQSPMKRELLQSMEKSMDFDVALSKVPSCVHELLKADTLLDWPTVTGLYFLTRYCSSRTTDEQRVKWLTELRRYDVIGLVKHVNRLCVNPDFLNEVPQKSGTSTEWPYQAFNFTWSILWNGSDGDPQLSELITKNGLLEYTCEMLSRPDFKPHSLHGDMKRTWIVKACFGVQHNCLQHVYDECKRKLRDSDILKICNRWGECPDELVRVKAMIVVAYVADEEDMNALDSGDDIFHTMLNKLLKPALRTTKRRCLGYTVDETCQALNQLAKHDANKKRMVKYGVIDLYMEVLRAPANESEILSVIRGVWTLSFIPEAVHEIRRRAGAVDDIKKLMSHKNKAIAKAAQGALWNVHGRPPSRRISTSDSLRSSTGSRQGTGHSRSGTKDGTQKRGGSKGGAKDDDEKGPQGHIMISYDHAHKHLVRPINDRLKERGYKTWLDADQMSGSTLEAMAAAIEHATAVLLCFSERYQDSPNCRLEAEYAFQQGKKILPVRTERFKPSGWLGLILGTKFFPTCLSVEEVNECVDKIIKELGDSGLPEDSYNRRAVGSSGNDPLTESSRNFNGKPLQEWSDLDVQKWLDKNNLSHLGPKMSKFDGPLLAGLRSMYRSSPGVAFYQSAKDFLDIHDLPDLIRLTQLLDQAK